MFKKLAFGTAGLLLLVSPLVSSAQTISVQTQIDALLQQIAQLQTQLAGLLGQPTTPSVSSSQCLNLANALVIGSTDVTTNGEVSKLQHFLIAAGVYPEARTTGYYGLLTAQAVVRWQKAHGMDFVTTSSGVGPMTRGKMKCGSSTTSAVQKINWNIEMANPNITNPDDNKKYEQAISVDVTFADNSTKRYSMGTAYGCTGSTVQSTENGKTVLGRINCYYALSGVRFVAYTQNGRFVVERGDESARDGSVKTTVLLQQNSGNGQAQNDTLALDFRLAGHMVGSFQVKISDAHITYKHTDSASAKEVNKVERSLLPAELSDIRRTIEKAGLISLQSQDFTKEGLIPGQQYYDISITLNGKENKIECGYAPSLSATTWECQKQIDILRLKLNSVLGVNM